MRALGRILLALVPMLCACYGGTLERPYVTQVGGDPARGMVVIRAAGCGACHKVPGIRSADGLLGPPLDAFGRRAFIAGRVANSPQNLVRWLLDPEQIDPETVMPRVRLTQQQARDAAAYIYTLR